MNRRPKQKVSKSMRRSSRITLQNKKRVPYLLFALILGVAGAYYVFRSFAANNNPGEIYLTSSDITTQHAAGDPFTLTVYGNVPALDPNNTTGKIRLEIGWSSYSSQTDFSGSGCGALGCGVAGTLNAAGGDRKDVSKCFNINPSMFGAQGVTIFTLNYVAKVASPYNVFVDAKWSAGSCGEPPCSCYWYGISYNAGTSIGVNGSIGGGGGGGTPEGPPGGGGGGGSGGGNTGGDLGQGNTGQNTTPSQQGSGGGGGSSAQKQSNQPNNTPTASSQGDTKQTQLEPSPFFDGKEFKPGSDADTFANTAKKAGKTLLTKWYLLIAALLIGALAYWIARRYKLPQQLFRKKKV